MNNRPTIIITGSSGLLGSALVSHFLELGFAIRAFQRTVPSHDRPGVEYYPFDLSDVRDRGFAGAEYLVHCAYRPVVNMRERESNVNIDVEGTKKIIALARKHGIKLVFISTLAAHPRTTTYYGTYKLFLEGLFDAQKDLILKPGLMLGENGGLIGRISFFIQHHKIIPLLGGGRQRIQTIAVDDLCKIIEVGVQRNIAGTYMVAHPTPIFMKDIYRALAKKMRKRPLFIPIPLALAYHLLRLTERIGLVMPFDSENVLGLRHLEVFDTSSDVQAFGITPQDYET